MQSKDVILSTALIVAASACVHTPEPLATGLDGPIASKPDPELELRSAVTVLFEVFPHLDCELDRIVDVGEVDEHNSQVFRRYDRDHSINLSREEYAQIHLHEPTTLETGFATADRDGDGVITVMEFRNHLSGALKAVDVDDDGEVSLTELEGVWERLKSSGTRKS